MFSEAARCVKPTIGLCMTLNLNADPSQNIFNCALLLKQHLRNLKEENGQISSTITNHEHEKTGATEKPINLDVEDDEDEEEAEDSETGSADKPVKVNNGRRKFDAELEYDLGDDFIDDSDLFVAETKGIDISVKDYGYFVYQGNFCRQN